MRGHYFLMLSKCSIDNSSLLLSNINDPMFVGRLCEPIINEMIPNDAFIPKLINKSIIPEVKSIIKNVETEKFSSIIELTRLMIKNYPEFGIEIIKSEFFSTLRKTVHRVRGNYVKDVQQLFIEIASSLPQDVRDDIVIKEIQIDKDDTDFKVRQVAVYLIPVVSDSSRVLPLLRLLAKDRISSVRSSVVGILPDCTFESSVIDEILINAAKDKNFSVQKIAVTMIGEIAPHLVDSYCALLKNRNTTLAAFPQLPNIVEHNSFADVYEAFDYSCILDKNDAALALLETVSRVDPNKETSFYIKAAYELVSFAPFTWRLFSFAQHFTKRSDFIGLLDPTDIPDWRARYALLKQTEMFVPEFKSSLVWLAEIYSEDKVACVRDESVNLWISLLQNDPSIASQCIEKLTRGIWQKRLVLAKIINKNGREGFEDVIAKLSNDPAEPVRYCINNF